MKASSELFAMALKIAGAAFERARLVITSVEPTDETVRVAGELLEDYLVLKALSEVLYAPGYIELWVRYHLQWLPTITQVIVTKTVVMVGLRLRDCPNIQG